MHYFLRKEKKAKMTFHLFEVMCRHDRAWIFEIVDKAFNAYPVPSYHVSLDLHGPMKKDGTCQLGFLTLHAVYKEFC